MTLDDLRFVMPYSAGRLQAFAPPLITAMQEFGITTAQRQSAFLAQVAVESGELRYTLELSDGKGYEGRADLGNTQPGDGPLYRGRGLLQITGRTAYDQCGKALNMLLIARPSLLETPEGACRSAGWFWEKRGLNDLADQDQFGAITHRINGGYTALDHRIAYWIRARKVLGL